MPFYVIEKYGQRFEEHACNTEQLLLTQVLFETFLQPLPAHD